MPEASRRSIRSRLFLWLLPLATGLMLVAWVVHGTLMSRMLQNFLHDRLIQETNYVSSKLQRVYPAVDDWLATDTFFSESFHHMIVIRLGDRTWSSSSLLSAAVETWPGNSGSTMLEHDDQQLYAVRHDVSAGGLEGSVIVAENFSDLEADQAQLHLWVATVSIGLLLILVALIVAAVHLSLRPLSTLQQALQKLQRGDIERLDEATPVEFQQLVAQLNALLDTIERRLKRSREALANLSHSIRTPIAALTQVLSDGSVVIDAELRQQMTARLALIHRQLDAELRLHRLAGPQAGKRAQLTTQTRNLLWMFARLCRDKRFELLGAPELESRWPVEEQDFNELLGNVVDNAGKWAKSRVLVSFDRHDEALEISIEDDGPGVAEDLQRQLGTRGLRLDEQQEGHGLGLAIVRDILIRYGGTLDFTNSATLGGLRVRMTLPRAPGLSSGTVGAL